MTRGSWNTPFHAALPTLGTDRIRVDHAVRDLVTTYRVGPLEETALRFSPPPGAARQILHGRGRCRNRSPAS